MPKIFVVTYWLPIITHSWNIPLERDWRIMNTALTLPRYEHSVATIPSSQVSSPCFICVIVQVDCQILHQFWGLMIMWGVRRKSSKFFSWIIPDRYFEIGIVAFIFYNLRLKIADWRRTRCKGVGRLESPSGIVKLISQSYFLFLHDIILLP